MKIRKPADVKKPNLTVHPVLLEVWLFFLSNADVYTSAHLLGNLKPCNYHASVMAARFYGAPKSVL